MSYILTEKFLTSIKLFYVGGYLNFEKIQHFLMTNCVSSLSEESKSIINY